MKELSGKVKELQARQGEVDITRTAAGQRGASAGDQDLFASLATGDVGAPDPSQRAPDMPPPRGWYPDPEDASQLRWWDGQTWTDQRRPASP